MREFNSFEIIHDLAEIGSKAVVVNEANKYEAWYLVRPHAKRVGSMTDYNWLEW